MVYIISLEQEDVVRSCKSIDLNRKGLIDDDGVSLAVMLETNKGRMAYRLGSESGEVC